MTNELVILLLAVLTLVLLWVEFGTWGQLMVIAVDLFGAAVLSIPRGLTISTYVGLVRGGSVTTKYSWETPVAVLLANTLDKLETNHCALAKISDHAAAVAAAELTK